MQIEWKRNEKGQFVAAEVPGTEQVRPAQLVLLAMGFLGPEQPLLEQLAVERDARTNVKAEHEKYATNIRGRLCGRRRPARPKPGRLGLQRRPRRGPRMRPLPHGRNRFAVMHRARRWGILLTVAAAALAFTPAEEEQLPPLIHTHAHNDYEHHRPLFDALDHGFASVEADIHLVDGQLLVAHSRWQVKPGVTLQSLYLDPLRERARRFNGRIYPNGDPTFYLLIDTKTGANETWAVLRDVLAKYIDLLTRFDGDHVERKAVTVVLTGNRPRGPLPHESDRRAGLDGQMPDLDRPNPHDIFLWMSEDWKHFFKWNGHGPIPPDEKARLLDIVARSHARHMKVRFWDSPESTNFWTELRADGVGLINADDLPGLEKFLRQEQASAPQ